MEENKETMNTPAEFDEIRPYSPEELPQVFEELLADPMFQSVVKAAIPDMTEEKLRHVLSRCKTNLDVQKNIFYSLLLKLISEHSDGFKLDVSALPDKSCNYTFISNHRDIVLDASFMNLSLLRRNYKTTEVAIGNNLLIYPWIEDLVRLNKSIVVKRDVGMRQALEAAEQLSGYIHFALTQKHESVWIAQRQGRAKDSSDGTQESLIKMLGIAGGKDYIDNIMEVNLLPVAISYEFDPNDYLKAREFLLKKKFPDFKKTQRDDLFSMETGLLQNKGRVHFSFTPCINDQLEELRGLEKTEQVERICKIIDSNIHCHYRIYPCNYIAYDRRFKTDRFKNEYTEADIESFTTYLNGQLEKVKKEVDFEITADDREYMLEMMLVMYSNPLCNKLKATDSL